MKLKKSTKYQIKYETLPPHQIDKIQSSISTSDSVVYHGQHL